MYNISGHHHISMLTKDANKNNNFYHKILGLRRVKVTVNQDNPSMYHLFYGDRTGSPGTELSFFEIPNSGRTHRGTNAITRIGLLVPSEKSLEYWKERFEQYKVPHGEITTYAKRPALHFEDKDGLHLVLLVAKGEKAKQWEAWEKSSVPLEHQIRGLGPIEITVRKLEKLVATLTSIFNYTKVHQTDEIAILQAVEGEAIGEIVVKSLSGTKEKPGRGSIHHLAIRAKNDAELLYWDEKVKDYGFKSTGIIDRFYFKSLYFRESNDIMFEIATDDPGFTIDGEIETLREQLDLPPFLEDQRKKIEKKLKPIKDI